MDLITLFWNNVRVGQWEVACGFLDLLKEESLKHYKNLLVVLALQPSKYSSGSVLLSTPFHLSWLAVKELTKDTSCQEIKKLPAHILKELELKLLLNGLEAEVPPDIIQELLAYHIHLINQQHGLSHVTKPEPFTPDASKFIEELLKDSRHFSVLLSPSISGSSNISSMNNLSFTHIFGRELKAMMKAISNKDDVNNMTEDLIEVDHLLSLGNCYLDSSDVEFIDNLKSIMELHLSSNALNVTDLYSSLINPHNTKLLHTLDMEERYLKLEKRKCCSENWNSSTIAEAFANLCEHNETEDWELILLLCKEGKHILKSIVDGCTELLIQKEYEKVASMLSRSWLKCLTPLVVLLTWAQCSTFDETVIILKNLLDVGAEGSNFLTHACNKLIYQSKLIEWCMQQVSDFLGMEEDVAIMVTELFRKLKSSAVLYALNDTKLISILKFEQIVFLLEEQPRLQNDVVQEEKLSCEQDTFYSYSVLKRLLHLIMCNASGSLSEYNGENVQISNELITSYICDVQLDMNKICSHSIKVELLENIFSLLFLRRSDFKQSEREDIDCDNISLDSNVSRNRSGSFDSLSTTDDHMEEHSNRSLPSGIFSNPDPYFRTKDITEILLEELEESSSDTIKSTNNGNYNNTNNTLVTSANMSRGFLITRCLLKELLEFIATNLREISLERKKNNESDTSSLSSSIDHRITKISSYISEARWRMELVSGLQYDELSPSSIWSGSALVTSERNIMNQMLGSSETLVYLTMKKQDLVQAKQVIKMFDLKDKQCCKEVHFMEQLSLVLDKLKTLSISSTSVESQLTHSPLDIIRSDASAGRTSLEVTQIAETLLQHSNVMGDCHDVSMVETAICVDLMFSVPLSFPICKSLLDLASLKSAWDLDDNDSYICNFISTKVKLMKTFLQFMNSKKHVKMFSCCGQDTPSDFLTLYMSLPSKALQEMGVFNNIVFFQGKAAFHDLQEIIKKLHQDYKQIMDEQTGSDEKDLSDKVTSLFATFTPDVISKFNNVSSIHDYLKSLFKYVNKLARWQLNPKIKTSYDSEGYGAESSGAERDVSNSTVPTMQAANPFLVFNEDISKTFGRLLFDWEMPPKKLEGFAHQASIKLIKIVAEKCGVFVGSSKKLRRKGEWLLLFRGQCVLNKCESEGVVTEGKSPNELVEKLLKEVFAIKNKHKQWNAAASEITEVLSISAVELCYIDLNELKESSQKLMFFINLFNLLFLHGFMLIVSGKSHAPISFEELSQLLQCSFGRFIFHNHVAYNVGTLGVVSALDVYKSVIKCQSASNFFGIHNGAHTLKKYGIENTDCCALFGMLHGISDSSLIQVPLTSSSDISSLETSQLDYLQDYIKVDDNKSEIWVPEFIFVHRKCFSGQMRDLANRLSTSMTSDEDEERNGTDSEQVNDDIKRQHGRTSVTGNNADKFKDAAADLRNAVNNVVERSDDMNDHSDNSSCEGDATNDSCYNQIHSMLISLSKLSTSEFNNKLQYALEKSYMIKIENHNWSHSNNTLNPDASSLTNNPVIQKIQTFLLMSEEISSYLKESSLLAGTLVELCLVKNQLMKHITTIFHNNILYNSDDEHDKKLSVCASLQDGVKKFKGITRYSILSNLMAVSSSMFESIMKSTEYFEFSLPSSLMNKFYSSVQNLLSDKFIVTLSPDQWSEISPVLLQCGFYSKHFWKILLANLELFVHSCDSVFEIILSHCISEIRDWGTALNSEKFDLKSTLKRLLLLQKPGNMSQYILECKYLLSSNDAIDLLKICLEDASCDDNTRSFLITSLKKCEWYEQVHRLHLLHGDKTFSSWQDVKHVVQEEPEKISSFLIRLGKYHLIDTWCEIFHMPEQVYEHCLQMKLKNILTKQNVDYLTLQSTLDKIESKTISRRICQHLLTENNGYSKKKIFIIHYMTNALSEQLEPSDRVKLLLNKIGISLIEMIPPEIQSSYQCLENNPLLIVEQLLMNMKVTLVAKAIECIHLECTQQGGKLLSNLEAGCDELIVRYAQLALDVSRLKQSECSDGPNSDEDVKLRRWSSVSVLSSKKERKENQVPLQPVDSKKWVKDKEVISCMQCRDLFNMFNRRHHCRHCGRVTCATCSPYYCYMSRYKRKERTCVRCYDQNYKEPKSVVPNSEVDIDNDELNIPHDMYVFDTPSPHILTCNTVSNTEIRASFTYEKAPSAGLCLSIVDLYTNHCAAAGLLIKFCKELSQYIHEHHKDEGIDLNMVVGMIEMILHHAKLKFLKAGDFDGIELTERYRSQIEVMKILVESKWHEIPTLQELSQPESLRRLRDQLIENEQFKLATEVTSKCAFDTTANFLMAFSRLKYGDFDKARELFARCLTNTQGEIVGVFGPNHHYVERIVEQIENSPMLAMNPSAKVGDTLLLTPLVQDHKNSTGDHTLDTRRYKEIVFYIKTYGSSNQLIKFFMRNHLYKKAVVFIRNKTCSSEQFVNDLLLPSFQEGCFDLLCSELRNNDPSHKFWDSYINNACKILEKRGLYHCLYELQLFIKDYYRAALTCVRFYLGSTSEPSSTYTQLNLRLRYLIQASKHLEDLLKERNSRSSFVSYVGPTDDKINQEIPVKDIKHRLYTVQLQMDVTALFNSDKVQNDQTKLFTLFGNGKERAELVVQILLLCCNESISLASKIIQEFKLPSLPTLSRAVNRITRLGKYDLVSWMIQQLEQGALISLSEKDEIYLHVVKAMTGVDEGKNANQFIKCIKSDVVKVKAYMVCGRLRDAYLEAVKKERVEEIEKILDEARKVNQRNMVDICEKWLKNYHGNPKRKTIN